MTAGDQTKNIYEYFNVLVDDVEGKSMTSIFKQVLYFNQPSVLEV